MDHTPEQSAILALLDRIETLEKALLALSQEVMRKTTQHAAEVGTLRQRLTDLEAKPPTQTPTRHRLTGLPPRIWERPQA